MTRGTFDTDVHRLLQVYLLPRVAVGRRRRTPGAGGSDEHYYLALEFVAGRDASASPANNADAAAALVAPRHRRPHVVAVALLAEAADDQ